ncbi:hypothetical protein [Actinoplanes sp. N902-109]|uniref:hypothetical protein n=1 Tax=Actinoplanes sp. (strain N902-109) TaxID=649831 RepID=UPI0003293DD8|nr:hypothetical protein [Actinoplanes sp. N902-109]AGL13856.1 hypothetical protein L083_0346 [Actinoplanes sp. N902-109]
MSVWDDPDLRAGGEFVKLENRGDRVSGLITAVRSHTFDDGKKVPQVLFVDDVTGDERTWTAGQVQAKTKLSELRPEAGDWFSAELTDIERRAGGKTLKHFSIEVNRGGRPAAGAAAAGAAAAQQTDMASVFANLTPEQRAALQQQAATAPPF